MCIHANYDEEKCEWIPSIKIIGNDDNKKLICEKCGRDFNYSEYIKLIQILDPNKDMSFTHCFGYIPAPIKYVIEAELKNINLD